ncbi:MAG: glycosyltransferase family 2 protein [Acidobacteria bacterium]|nr:glycosyltransferase family 2 protein [Acidobacteriota bacterium]MBI3662885.1 glycosyltransferase family 2 protein [Acidobacteriota bacterium]
MTKTADAIKYSIVVPVLDEQENIPPLYVKLTEVMDALAEPYEIVFVDDGSRDQSYRVLAEIYESDRRVNLIRLRRNFGQTPALKAGFDFARGEIIITLDADLQNDPEDIPRLLAKLAEGYDIVSGWRKDRKEPWLTRRLPSRIANWIMARISGVPLHDFGSTLKVYRREIIQDLPLYGDLHRFIPALASWSGARIAEIVVRHHPRRRGSSKYGLGRTGRVVLDFFSIKFLLDYSTKPLQFFGLFGLLGAGIGGALGFYLLYLKVILGESIFIKHGPMLLLSMALIVSGIQFISIGLLGEMLARTYFESQGKPVYAVREVKSRRQEALTRDSHDAGPPRA